jgi:alkanesulfonate monooxygenase SsuD/methylene tetrahydromethanopterin reductase-like flavin-dependent oxidoreductase (luciferase family)
MPIPLRPLCDVTLVLVVDADAACTQRPRRWQTRQVILDVQFNSATTPWPEMRDAVLAAEAAGYGVAWVVDHLAGQVMAGDSMLECFTLTGALAATTSTIGVGTLVANVWNRPLGILAAAAATAQMVADGRFWLGIGAGASPVSAFGAEHAAVGIDLHPDMATRHARVADFLTLARRMWATGEIDGVTGFPQPPSRIPMVMGVNSVALARLAAREVDGINIRSNHPRLEAIIDAAREARPADMPPLLVTTWVRTSEEIRDPDSEERLFFEKIGIDRLIVVQFDRADPTLL